MEKIVLNEIELESLRTEVRNRVYANKYLTNPDGNTIIYAKEVAKEHKTYYQHILRGMRPCGNIQTNVWDETGKIVPYKKIFY